MPIFGHLGSVGVPGPARTHGDPGGPRRAPRGTLVILAFKEEPSLFQDFHGLAILRSYLVDQPALYPIGFLAKFCAFLWSRISDWSIRHHFESFLDILWQFRTPAPIPMDSS